MDADSLKIVFAIAYLTLLVVIGCIWFRVTHAPNGDLYRRVRKAGGYHPLEDEPAADYGAPKPNSST
jgi:hypothetical protein